MGFVVTGLAVRAKVCSLQEWRLNLRPETPNPTQASLRRYCMGLEAHGACDARSRTRMRRHTEKKGFC